MEEGELRMTCKPTPKPGQLWKLNDHAPLLLLLYSFQSKDTYWKVLCWNGQTTDVGEWSLYGGERSSLFCDVTEKDV